MSAFELVGKHNYASKYVRLTPSSGIQVDNSHNQYSLRLSGTPDAVVLGGKESGLEPEDGKVKAGQSVIMTLGSVHPYKYHVLVDVNPEMYQLGMVNYQSVYDPEDGVQAVRVVLHAKVAVDLSQLPTDIIRIYGMD